MQDNAIAGKVVVITGGARGIGLATAQALHRRGARVAIGDIDEVLAKEAGSDSDLEMYGPLDVTSAESFSEFLDDVERRLGPIDVLINNAGIMNAGLLIDEPDSLTRRTIDVDVYGVILGSKLAIARMIPRGHGHVINIASLAGEGAAPGMATYCASKHAVVGFTESLRREIRATGVKVSAVLPTLTNTDMVAGIGSLPFLRNAEPEQIAQAICDLIASPRPRVAVTRSAGWFVGAQKLLPNRVGEQLLRILRLDRLFVEDVNTAARSAYTDRLRGD